MNQRLPSAISRLSAIRHRYVPLVWISCIGVAFTLASFFVVRWWEAQNIEKAFRLAAEDRAAAVSGTFDIELAMLELVRSSVSRDGQVQRTEFDEVLGPFFSRSHSIEAVQWVPCVPDSRRLDFEAAAQRDGLKNFHITEMDKNGQMAPAPRRDEYFPICFVGPQPGDNTVWGYNIASEPTRLEALRLARDTGKTVASGRITFVEDRAERDGFLVCLPVYEKDKPTVKLTDRRKHFLGLIVGVVQPGKMLEVALARLQPIGIDVCLYDPSVPADGRPFRFHASRSRKNVSESKDSGSLSDLNDAHHHQAELDVAGHPWTIDCAATPGFATVRRIWWSWGVLAVGLALTAKLAARLRLGIDRRTYMEQLLVEKRRYAQELEEKVTKQTADICRAHEEVMCRLVSASQWRDEETGMHIRRTGLFSEVLAKAAGWSDAEAAVIRQAAPMHDVGKIGIPDAILRKPGKLTPAEYDIMKTHTLIGAEMLAGSDEPMLQMALEIALNHHERWDGQGYPHGLSGENIPESARILAIVDMYDALTHDRVYRPAMTEDDVLAIMRQNAGTHFDPLLLTHFFAQLEEIHHIEQTHPNELVDFYAVGHSQQNSFGDQLPEHPVLPQGMRALWQQRFEAGRGQGITDELLDEPTWLGEAEPIDLSIEP